MESEREREGDGIQREREKEREGDGIERGREKEREREMAFIEGWRERGRWHKEGGR